MRAEGMLSCRSLSFKGASFRLVPVTLEEEKQAAAYAGSCKFWQTAFQLIVRLLKARTREVKQKKLKHSTELKENSLHMRHFWSAQQQFFRQLLICSKVDAAVSLATAAQLRGEAVVIAMWSTGESVTEAIADREGDRAAAAAGFASAPKEVALRMLKGLLRTVADSVESEPSALQEIQKAEEQLERPLAWTAKSGSLRLLQLFNAGSSFHPILSMRSCAGWVVLPRLGFSRRSEMRHVRLPRSQLLPVS
ncbi:FGT1 [Symbiodinium pilosum]|uniref:FGT1 protein n=1 Tax=Symbiodinium pilosum TaxID=2952 RepID=A0A812YIS1_SYMPI|nr:FGT1 [Symbiodinium pilosum]